MTFTTGSTGIPKAADRTHAFLQAQLEALDPLLAGISSPCLTTLPIVVLLHLARGRTTLLPPARFNAAKADTLHQLSNTVTFREPRSLIMSPAIIDSLTQSIVEHRGELGFVSSVLTGGGAVYPDLAARLVETFPNASINAVYGSTEAEPISHIDAIRLSNTSLESFLKLGLPVGHPDPAATVRILRPDAVSDQITSQETLHAQLVADGEPGEIIVSGAHVLRHYINNPRAESEIKIRIGNETWHRSGDCGRFGDDGSLFLLGRVSEIIEWRGRQLFPTILSYLLRVEAGIPVSAVLLRDLRLLLVIERDADSQGDAGIATLERHGIGGAELQLVEAIPRDPRHRTKVDYGKLRKML